jgi:hypothetical protein
MLSLNTIIMKLIKLILLILISFLSSIDSINAQSINWQSLKIEDKQIVNAHVGFEYAIVYGIAYSYRLKSVTPIFLNVDFSVPAGKKVFDDLKTKVGGQARLYKFGDFQFSASIHGIYRRYENPLVRMQNFGSEMKGIVGYYKSKWFAAAEIGFDKAIVTHFKHSDLYKEFHYSAVTDGWYQPSTGGNFNFGLQAGYSFSQSDITMKFGRVVSQDFKTNPSIPVYAELGYNFKMYGKRQ